MDKLRAYLESVVRVCEPFDGERITAEDCLSLLTEAEEENAKRFGDCLNCEYHTVATTEMCKAGGEE